MRRKEGVTSELVSEAKFPASREVTGNFIESGLGGASTAAKKGIKPKPYRPIPYASEQGIFYGLAGNLNRRSGKFPPSSGNPALVRYLEHFALPNNPIYRSFREISTVCREGKEGRRQMLASPSPPLAIPSFASHARCTELQAGETDLTPSERLFVQGGTESSNPASSSKESANFRSLSITR